MNSFLRWAGSKRQLLPVLRQFWKPSMNRYVEPFAGSACFYFDVEPHSAVLGDLNGELVNALKMIKRDVHLVIQCIKRLPKGESGYYRVRAADPRILAPAAAAARFIYLNHYCFNGLYRTNKKGGFNVPYGPPKSNADIDWERLVVASSLLRSATIVQGDFELTLKRCVKGDFVYMDPPYVVVKQRIFSDYMPGSFSHEDLKRLHMLLLELEQKGVHFVVSYEDSTEARILFSKWRTMKVDARRNIAGFVGSRRTAVELIATNIEAG